MRLLFSTTLLVSAALLFSVQPMVAKHVLPILGGTPAVWTTCMLFFQAALLAGYAAALGLVAVLGPRGQVAILGVVLVLALATLPPAFDPGTSGPAAGTDPTAWLLATLVATVGVPFFVLAMLAPLLQTWFARTGHPTASDPYDLYRASNLGSLVGLLVYPLAIEPGLRLADQARGWGVGFALLSALVAACGAAMLARGRGPEPEPEDGPVGAARLGDLVRWGALAFVPSSLMLGLTTYLTTDIAPIPLLWAVPLAIYLATFIVAFSRRPLVPPPLAARALPIAVMVLAPVLCAGQVQAVFLPVHLATFALAGLVCHGELARLRPPSRRLTAFYLAIALGGALGGLFNAQVAPRIFDRVAEYPLAIVLACLAVPVPGTRVRWPDLAVPAALLILTALLVSDLGPPASSVWQGVGVMAVTGTMALVCWTHRVHPVRFALAIGAVLLGTGLASGVDGRVLRRERDFFGAFRVTRTDDGLYHRLFHGSTLHGQQALEVSRRREPLTFFHPTGPVGAVVAAHRDRPASPAVAVVGLGVGTLAAYALPGEGWTFYEIDPAVARIASDARYFTYLRDSASRSLAVVLGDARLRLREAPDGGFGLIVLDAFNSDAPPVHLLTREAMALYRRKLAPGGRIAVHISNRYLDLEPVVSALALDSGLIARVRSDLDVSRDDRRLGKQPSVWTILAATEAALGPIATDPLWRPLRARPGLRVWTDDHSDLISCFSLRPIRPPPSPPSAPRSTGRPQPPAR